MKKNVQMTLSALVFVIILAATVTLSTFTYRYMLTALSKQTLSDNAALGRQLLTIIANHPSKDEGESAQVTMLQDLCNNISLPNGGFVCAANKAGDIVALPGMNPKINAPIPLKGFLSVQKAAPRTRMVMVCPTILMNVQTPLKALLSMQEAAPGTRMVMVCPTILMNAPTPRKVLK